MLVLNLISLRLVYLLPEVIQLDERLGVTMFVVAEDQFGLSMKNFLKLLMMGVLVEGATYFDLRLLLTFCTVLVVAEKCLELLELLLSNLMLLLATLMFQLLTLMCHMVL